ncbi:hypothetical protein L6R52_02880 [Myxococcota bacterium]|nr:hypothetical protein [Myxococcota bacterium]
MRCVVVLAFVLAWAACADEVPPNGPPVGTFEFPGGVTLVIPEGALDAPVELSVTGHSNAELIPAEMRSTFVPLDAAVVLEPDGLELARPATLRFTSDTIRVPTSTVAVLTWSKSEDTWIDDGTVGVVGADGHQISVEITHFSGRGSSGLEGFLTPHASNPDRFFEEWIAHVQSIAPDLGEGDFIDACCMVVRTLEYEMRYWDAEGDRIDRSRRDGSAEPGDRIERYESRSPGSWSNPHWWLSAEVHHRYERPFLDVDPVNDSLCYDEPRRRVGYVVDMTCAGKSTFPAGQTAAIAIEGPGSVNPSTLPLGRAPGFEYVAPEEIDEEAEVRMTVRYDACDASSDQHLRETVAVTLFPRCVEWHGELELSLDHPWPDDALYSRYRDALTLTIIFEIDDDGVVGGTFGGSRTVDVTPGEGCTLGSLTASDLVGAIEGTLDPTGLHFGLVPDITPLTFTMTCDDDSYPIPEYAFLEVMLIAEHVRIDVPLTDLATDEGSGTEDFGDDVPMYYEWAFVLRKG